MDVLLMPAATSPFSSVARDRHPGALSTHIGACHVCSHLCSLRSVPSPPFQRSYSAGSPRSKMDEFTRIDYNNIESKSDWLSPSYLNLQFRCARLINCEATKALKQHFGAEKSCSQSSLETAQADYGPIIWNPAFMDAIVLDEDHSFRTILEESFC